MSMNNLTMTIFGDICPTEDYIELFKSGKPEMIVHDIIPLIAKNDFCIANLEAPAISEPSPIKKCGPTLSIDEEDLALLSKAGINAVSLANNHIKDHGEKAVLNTIEKCHMAGIDTFGAGENLDLSAKPLFFEKDGIKVGVFSCGEIEFNAAGKNAPGANYFDPYTTFELIQDIKDKCDYLVVLYHGGIEHYRYPSPLLRKKCRAMIRFGADIVLCQHSHCIGTQENYKGGSIIYGQGNSVFGYRNGDDLWNNGLIVEADFSKEGFKISLLPICAKPDGVCLADKKMADAILQDMNMLSENISDEDFIEKEWDKFCSSQAPLDVALMMGYSRILNKLNRILKNRIILMFNDKNKFRIMKNLVRCDAHHEVLVRIYENLSEK